MQTSVQLNAYLRKIGYQLANWLSMQGVSSIPWSSGTATRIPAFPLTTDLTWGDFDLKELVPLLYGKWLRPAAADPEEVLRRFNAVQDKANSPAAQRGSAIWAFEAALLDGLPEVSGQRQGSWERLVRCLSAVGCAPGWSIAHAHQEILLAHPDGVMIRVSATHLEAYVKGKLQCFRRLRSPMAFNFKDSLAAAGTSLSCLSTTGAAYANLVMLDPGSTGAFTLVFSAACMAGSESERELTSYLDFQRISNDERVTLVASRILKATKLVTEARSFPYQELFTTLRGLPSKLDFEKLFGIESQWSDVDYTPTLRQIHRVALLNIQQDIYRELGVALASDSDPERGSRALALQLSKSIR